MVIQIQFQTFKHILSESSFNSEQDYVGSWNDSALRVEITFLAMLMYLRRYVIMIIFIFLFFL